MTQLEIFAVRHAQWLTIKWLEVECHQEGSDSSGHYRPSEMASQTNVAATSECSKDVRHLSLGITHTQKSIRDEFIGILVETRGGVNGDARPPNEIALAEEILSVIRLDCQGIVVLDPPDRYSHRNVSQYFMECSK